MIDIPTQSIEVTCPSGLRGVVRKLTGKEAAILADRSLSRQGTLVDEILRRVWISTVEAEPYPFKVEQPIPWSKVLIGDRDFVFLQTRIVTHGVEYSFKIRCDDCGDSFSWDIDLSKLPVQSLEGENLERFKDGNVFEGVLPSGRGFKFRLARGEDAARVLRSMREQRKGRRDKHGERMKPNPLIESVLMRLIEIEDVGNKPSDRREFIESMGLDEIASTLDEMDRVDCGVNMTIAVCCPSCENEFDVNLPFDENFLLPRVRRKSVGSTETETATTD